MTLEVERIGKEEVRENDEEDEEWKGDIGPGDIPVDVWKRLRESALKFLTKLYIRTMESEKMLEEWRDSVLMPLFKNRVMCRAVVTTEA